jgi:hypothetical protein
MCTSPLSGILEFASIKSHAPGGLIRLYYILDSNIWVDLSQGKFLCSDLRGETAAEVVVAPFMIIELVRGMVKGGDRYYLANRAMFECMAHFRILELSKICLFKTLWNSDGGGVSNVHPETYKVLLKMIIESQSLADFLNVAEHPNSSWQRITDLDSIHERVLDKELLALAKLADRASLNAVGTHMARLYRLGGLVPDPARFETRFSAALEYLRSFMLKVRQGAKPLKNDRGMYVDHQILFYLADPEAVVVSNEDFDDEIRTSPQKNRIIKFKAFRNI